ncbi:glucosamine inositolphosphorylceramide transferase family protein [Paenibacillus pectinilyticus]|uniref:glucosamine inositolphosphorylceramide transferase family protein n=1 Tax=Paenibacillus pectinilyticus TaxID=512399 RepID=UPI001428A2DE|nr:family 43 glycosylhydrolase [Paenibacillus pectinilyticus]
MEKPSLQASDVTDVPAEFVADPFIIQHGSEFFLFFEILNKASGQGEIGVASSSDGVTWKYGQVVLREKFHLSYPQVFIHNNKFYMLPETAESDRVILYKAKNFPNEWEVACELMEGQYLDPSLVHIHDKWWMFAGTETDSFHIFSSDQLEGPWLEHPQSPIISGNDKISRPGGRLIVSEGHVYRYTQADYPHYGDSVRVFKVNTLTEEAYEEEEVSLILSGSKKENDWRKDGMHHIDQLQLKDNRWLVAVDGHTFKNVNYVLWKLDRMKSKLFSRVQ